MISFNIIFFPMHFLGLAGMPRRYADYPAQFTDFNEIATIGAFWFGLSQLIFLYLALKAWNGRGEPAAANPWEGATWLEWTGSEEHTSELQSLMRISSAVFC